MIIIWIIITCAFQDNINYPSKLSATFTWIITIFLCYVKTIGKVLSTDT